ncbi:MAG: dihydropteroate synthase [Coxiellaceae bacterium]|nr:dihydropteroate synthase [Coxiellaceae bacterium]
MTRTLKLPKGIKKTLEQPMVMGVINMSPNSFYQPCASLEQGLAQAEQMIAEGADMLDIGGEATNPFVDIPVEAPATTAEIERVVPLIAALKQRHPNMLLSVDTSNAAVMQAAIDAGVDMINDQRALRRDGALEVVANSDVAVCLMHFFMPQRIPQSNSAEAMLQQIAKELQQWAQRCVGAGIAADRIVLDPGFGGGNFGKDTAENFYLLRHMDLLHDLGYPLLVGWSRKSMIGDVLGGVSSDQRLYGSVAAATLAAVQGADILRVHDVAPTVDAVKVFSAALC